MMLKSPDQLPMVIDIAGIKITVEEVKQLNKVKNKMTVGMSDYPNQKIILNTQDLGIDLLNQALYHEMLHWIFFLLNEFEICNNEKLIDSAALLLHDSMKSFK